ncbi:MAG: hypothetical protein JWN70_2071 [Planctomycetaceae bacterium]|nr:hypothetical protein [Planctomycetaceae bacterium]
MTDTPETHQPRLWKPTLIEWVLIVAALLLMACILNVAILQARDAARISQSKNNLKQVGLALHNYESTTNVLPPGGVFNSSGVPYHSWTTSIAPYLSASPWYNQVNFSVPWDDPTQVEHFMNRWREPVWENPRAELIPRQDGLAETTYAGNSWILHRNSTVSLKEIENPQDTLLVAEARGHYLPLGCPGNWRDVQEGLNRSPDSFGLRDGVITQVLYVDGHVQAVQPETDSAVWASLAGPPGLRPQADRVQRPQYPYQLPNVPFWRNRTVITGHKMMGIEFRLDPTGTALNVSFNKDWIDRSSRDIELNASKYRLDELDQYGGIQHVTISGDLQAGDLNPFLELQRLKRLTLSSAKIQGDWQGFRRQLNSRVLVD